jgi:hypothetical protein
MRLAMNAANRVTQKSQATARATMSQRATHATKKHAAAHDKMGLTQRWGEVLEELVEYVKSTAMG